MTAHHAELLELAQAKDNSVAGGGSRTGGQVCRSQSQDRALVKLVGIDSDIALCIAQNGNQRRVRMTKWRQCQISSVTSGS